METYVIRIYRREKPLFFPSKALTLLHLQKAGSHTDLSGPEECPRCNIPKVFRIPKTLFSWLGNKIFLEENFTASL